jgi:phage-related holin
VLDGLSTILAFGCLRTQAIGCLRTQAFGCLRTQAFAAFGYQRKLVLNFVVLNFASGCLRKQVALSLRQLSTAFGCQRKLVLNLAFGCPR